MQINQKNYLKTEMTIKIGINGMGRIGRMIVRSIFESRNKNLKIQHINNRSNSEATGKLIRYDSIHGLSLIHI